MKLLLIDGNNLCYRMFHSPQARLTNKGHAVGVMFGFFKSLVSLHKTFPDHFRIIAWEGGYARRLQESEQAVKDGIIPDVYKGNRSREITPEVEDFRAQRALLREALQHVRCMQVTVDKYEADDVIYSYCQEAIKYKGEAVIVSSDHDFYQCLAPGITIHDAMKQETWTSERFDLEYNMNPSQWLEMAALEGETGDNIYGIDGWGPVTARKYIREFGTAEAVVEAVKAKSNRNKKEEALLVQESRIRLAKSLKKMDMVPSLPKPRPPKSYSATEMETFLLDVGFASLLKEIPRLI